MSHNTQATQSNFNSSHIHHAKPEFLLLPQHTQNARQITDQHLV